MSRSEVGIKDLAAESVLIGGGGRAILLQVANRGVGHGVADHSDFAFRAVDRLRTTMTYIFAVVYGTEEEKRTAVSMVNKAHVPVHTDQYNAFDPELQLWVAATLYDSAVQMYGMIFGPLEDATADRVYREYAVLGTALQVPEGMWPRDRAAFAAYWDEKIDSFEVDDKVRQVAADLFKPKVAPLYIRAFLPAYKEVTTALLPERLRSEFGLSWNAGDQRRFDLLIALVRFTYPKVPRQLRQLPKTIYLWAMRRRMAKTGSFAA